MFEGLKPLLISKYSELYQLCQKNGVPIRFVQGYRSPDAQAALWQQGRDSSGNVTDPSAIVTNAKPGQSMHNYGIAFDVVEVLPDGTEDWGMSKPGNWDLMGRLGESIGLEWGGDWTGWQDHPHFQMTFGHAWQDFFENKVDYSLYDIKAVPAQVPLQAAQPEQPVQPVQAAPVPTNIQPIQAASSPSWFARFWKILSGFLGK